MKGSPFPSPESANEEGVVAMGGILDPDLVTHAYLAGIFPWPHPGWPLLWFSPDPRAILDFSSLHVPKSLSKRVRKTAWKVTYDSHFRGVVQACAATPRPGQAGTWINDEMIALCEQMFRRGQAHSTEIWTAEGDLVGGLYGMKFDTYVTAESMFFLQSGASKWALVQTVQRFAAESKSWIDLQMLTRVSEFMGGQTIPRREFLQRIGSLNSKGVSS